VFKNLLPPPPPDSPCICFWILYYVVWGAYEA
jgi:hypothetical protein